MELILDLGEDLVGSWPAGLSGEAGNAAAGRNPGRHGPLVTETGAGTLAVAFDTQAGASGTADVRLVYGVRSFTVNGTWICVKPAGF